MSQEHKCSLCGASFEGKPPCFPFCSERCKLIDLGNWASGRYVISRSLSEEEQVLLEDQSRKDDGGQDE